MTDLTPEWLHEHGFDLCGDDTYKNGVMWVQKNPYGSWTLNITDLHTVTAQAHTGDVEKLADALRMPLVPEDEDDA